MYLDNKNYKLLLIIPCKIENMASNIYIAITLEKTKIFFFNFRIVAGSLPYKSSKLDIKISYSCREIAFCLVGYFNVSHPIHISHNNRLIVSGANSGSQGQLVPKCKSLSLQNSG